MFLYIFHRDADWEEIDGALVAAENPEQARVMLENGADEDEGVFDQKGMWTNASHYQVGTATPGVKPEVLLITHKL